MFTSANSNQSPINIEEIKKILNEYETKKVKLVTSQYVPKGKLFGFENTIGCNPQDENIIKDLIKNSSKLELDEDSE